MIDDEFEIYNEVVSLEDSELTTLTIDINMS